MKDDRNIMAGTSCACKASIRQPPLAEVGRFIEHRKHAPKSVVLHNCKFPIEAIRMLGLTSETRLSRLGHFILQPIASGASSSRSSLASCWRTPRTRQKPTLASNRLSAPWCRWPGVP